MRKIFLITIGCFLLVSCGGEEATSADNVSKTAANLENKESSDAIVSVQKLEALGDVCSITGDEVAAIIGWSGHSEGRPNGINSDTRKACDYGAQTGNLSITFERYDERAIKREWLSNYYAGELAKSGQINVQATTSDLGDQSIYSHGKSGPIYEYVLKWRFGNHTQKTVRFTSSNEQDATLKQAQLEAIALKLQ